MIFPPSSSLGHPLTRRSRPNVAGQRRSCIVAMHRAASLCSYARFRVGRYPEWSRGAWWSVTCTNFFIFFKHFTNRPFYLSGYVFFWIPDVIHHIWIHLACPTFVQNSTFVCHRLRWTGARVWRFPDATVLQAALATWNIPWHGKRCYNACQATSMFVLRLHPNQLSIMMIG